MDRFEFMESKFHENESLMHRDYGIKIQDGNRKTTFENGELILTTHRLLWGSQNDIARGITTRLCLRLQCIASLSEENVGLVFFGKKTRIILHLLPPLPYKFPGPANLSGDTDFVKISGKNGLNPDFVASLKDALNARFWEATNTPPLSQSDNPKPTRNIILRTGIVGIERSIEQKQKQANENISLAFQDLKALMAMAKDMVNLSKVISTKIKEHKGEISEDETVQFKSYLMSLGIDDPVTRENFTSNVDYFRSLSIQICEMMLDPIEEAGGMMSLSDVYCRVNRARGLELLSPEDLLNACKFLDGPIKLRKLPSGAMVLQLESHDDEIVAEQTAEKVEQHNSLSVEDLARIVGISILLAKERLLASERFGKICRDESVEGLRFYPNLFLRGQ